MKMHRTTSGHLRSKASTARVEKVTPKATSANGKYKVFSSTLKPRHLSARLLEQAVDEVIASRKTA